MEVPFLRVIRHYAQLSISAIMKVILEYYKATFNNVSPPFLASDSPGSPSPGESRLVFGDYGIISL